MLKEQKTLYAQQAEHQLLYAVREFHACKQEEGQSVSSYALIMKSYIENLERLGYAMTQNLAGLRGSKKLKPGALNMYVGYGHRVAVEAIGEFHLYPEETMGYSFYYPPENKVFVTQNAEFFENSLITQDASGILEDLEIIHKEDTHPSIDTSIHHDEDD
nr:zinc finger, CCHC-type [Tanacetum cinerariifolium]